MRRPELFAICILAALAVTTVVSPAWAGTIATGAAAADVAKSDGFTLVTRTEPAPGAWDVWASKDGIAYEVKIDANSGSVIKAEPVEDND